MGVVPFILVIFLGIPLLAACLFLAWRTTVGIATMAVRAGAGRPWVGLSVVVVSASLGFLAYAMSVGLGGMPQSHGWAMPFGIFALGAAIMGLSMVMGSGAPDGVASEPSPPSAKRRHLLPAICCLGVAVVLVIPMFASMKSASSGRAQAAQAVTDERADLVTAAWYDYYQKLERDNPGNGATPVTKQRDPKTGRLFLSGPQGNISYTAEADMPPALPEAAVP